MTHAKDWLAGLSSLAITVAPVIEGRLAFAQTGSPAGGAAPETYAAEAYAPLSTDELDALVAPIALYPDGLVAQVLGAATWPEQVVAANQFMRVNSDLKGEALRQQVENRGWDAAVQSLTQFPSVLDQLARNITWTSSLGDAAANQQADVLAAIQHMRALAATAGNLKSGPEITVIQKSPDLILIEPAKPTVVYVPSYNPTVVYGAPVVVPAYAPDAAAAAAVTFGVGILVVAAVSSGSCGFGMTWGMGWNTASIHCGGGMYYGNPYWRGGYYPGYYPGYRPPYYYPPPRPVPPPRPTPLPERPIAGIPDGGAGGRPGGGRPERPTTGVPGGGAGGRPDGARPERPTTGLPSGGNSTRPGGPNQPPVAGNLPSTGRPQTGGPGTLPSSGREGRPASPSNRPTSQQPSQRAARGYGSSTGAPAGAASRPNAFSGSGGGRQQSARGNNSMASRGGGGGRR